MSPRRRRRRRHPCRRLRPLEQILPGLQPPGEPRLSGGRTPGVMRLRPDTGALPVRRQQMRGHLVMLGELACQGQVQGLPRRRGHRGEHRVANQIMGDGLTLGQLHRIEFAPGLRQCGQAQVQGTRQDCHRQGMVRQREQTKQIARRGRQGLETPAELGSHRRGNRQRLALPNRVGYQRLERLEREEGMAAGVPDETVRQIGAAAQSIRQIQRIEQHEHFVAGQW